MIFLNISVPIANCAISALIFFVRFFAKSSKCYET